MTTIADLIVTLEAKSQGLLGNERALTPDESQELRAIHQAMPHLTKAAEFFQSGQVSSNLITYKIVSDVGGKLKAGTRTACNFWNNFLAPQHSIVVRVGTFDGGPGVIAQAWYPQFHNGVWYGDVEFNLQYLAKFSSLDIAGTIVHEIAHTLGMGFDKWMPLFSQSTGKFYKHAVNDLASLGRMEVELDGLPGTVLSHWDEDKFGAEIMTGYKDQGAEHVLPVTIDVMELLGHRIIRRLGEKTDLNSLLLRASSMQFSRQREAKALDLDYFNRTELFETIPHGAVTSED